MSTDRISKGASALLFLLGLGSLTQIYLIGCISLSELVVFPIAPILYVIKYREFHRAEFARFANALIAVALSLLMSSWYNDTAFPFVLKSFAVVYSVWSFFIVFTTLLGKNLYGLRWFLIGVFLSSLITIYMFNPTAQVSESGFAYVGAAQFEEIVGGALFWTEKLKQMLKIPLGGFYYQFPTAIAILTPILYILVATTTTVSGRASSVAFLMSGVMIIIGRKKRIFMGTIGRHFFTFFFAGILSLFLIKQGYVLAARSGLLGSDAQSKYEVQTRKGTGFLTMLMSGRMGFFTAIPAALNRPLIGYGPYAEDTEGYATRFIMEYGDEQDVREFMASEQRAMAIGYRRQIPTHSYIMGAWVHYGLCGLLFYIWVLYLLYEHIKKYSAAVPQWYGYFAMLIPYTLWNIFFSPFNNRWEFALLMSCIFYARAVGKGKVVLPENMEMEARNFDAR